MKIATPLLIALVALVALPIAAKADAPAGERLGKVSFAVSCAPAVRAPFSRGVALLHDFWYDEAQSQFQQIAKTDPGCAMAHWGIAMSVFHQIWDRPDEHAVALAWSEMQAAQAHPAKTARERAYIAAKNGTPSRASTRARLGPSLACTPRSTTQPCAWKYHGGAAG